MKNLLAIDTSTEACSVALDRDGDVLERFEHAPMKHAELILPAVRALLAETGTGMNDLDVIAFGRGPGSFTSLRIGIGVVQGLAWGVDIPVVPVSSLAAVAQAVADARPMAAGERIVVAMDARMNEVFHASFSISDDGSIEAAGEECVSAPGDVVAEPPFVAAGNGFERYDELTDLAKRAVTCFADAWPRAGSVAKLARHWLQDHPALPAGLAQPVYVRNNVAEKPSDR